MGAPLDLLPRISQLESRARTLGSVLTEGNTVDGPALGKQINPLAHDVTGLGVEALQRGAGEAGVHYLKSGMAIASRGGYVSIAQDAALGPGWTGTLNDAFERRSAALAAAISSGEASPAGVDRAKIAERLHSFSDQAAVWETTLVPGATTERARARRRCSARAASARPRSCKQSDADEGRSAGLTTAEREELRELRRESARLRQENEFLKKPQPSSQR